MSYAMAAALQTTVYAALTGWSALDGVAVFDALPEGATPETYVLIGAEDVRDASDKTGAGAEHRITVSVISAAAGFSAAKAIAGAVCDALAATGGAMARGRIVGVGFLRARARRTADGRRIDLSFRARLEDDDNSEI